MTIPAEELARDKTRATSDLEWSSAHWHLSKVAEVTRCLLKYIAEVERLQVSNESDASECRRLYHDLLQKHDALREQMIIVCDENEAKGREISRAKSRCGLYRSERETVGPCGLETYG